MSWKRREFALVVAGILLVSGAIGLTTVNASAISRQLHDWKVLPEPERLTELYFTDHKKLPRVYAPGTPQTIAFTVHNLQYQTTTYHYVITQATDTGVSAQQLASGSFTLAQNVYQPLAVPVTLADLGNRSTISVTLTGSNETISYLVTKEGTF